METTINIVDAILSIADVIEAVAAFSQRSDVRKFTAKSQQITQGLITMIALVSTVIICLSLGIAQAIYREWKAVSAIPNSKCYEELTVLGVDSPSSIKSIKPCQLSKSKYLVRLQMS
jgi:hypothetical protein